MKNVDATPDEMEAAVGEQLRALRIHRNIDQKTLAERAGVSVRALRNLEAGAGSTLHTMVCVLRALGREDWLRSVGPVATINPLMLSRSHAPRQRASHARKAAGAPPGPA